MEINIPTRLTVMQVPLFEMNLNLNAAFMAAINDNNEILVIRRKKDGTIGLPGGKVEDDESITDAIVRECKEEIFLDIPSFFEFSRLTPLCTHEINVYKYDIAVQTLNAHLCILNVDLSSYVNFINSESANHDEHDGALMMSIDELLKLDADQLAPSLYEELRCIEPFLKRN